MFKAVYKKNILTNEEKPALIAKPLEQTGEINATKERWVEWPLSSVSGGACGSWKTVGTGAVPGQRWRGQLLLDRCLLTRHGRTRNVCCVPEDCCLCCYLPACVRVSTMLMQCSGTSRLLPPHTSLNIVNPLNRTVFKSLGVSLCS